MRIRSQPALRGCSDTRPRPQICRSEAAQSSSNILSRARGRRSVMRTMGGAMQRGCAGFLFGTALEAALAGRRSFNSDVLGPAWSEPELRVPKGLRRVRTVRSSCGRLWTKTAIVSRPRLEHLGMSSAGVTPPCTSWRTWHGGAHSRLPEHAQEPQEGDYKKWVRSRDAWLLVGVRPSWPRLQVPYGLACTICRPAFESK